MNKCFDQIYWTSIFVFHVSMKFVGLKLKKINDVAVCNVSCSTEIVVLEVVVRTRTVDWETLTGISGGI